MEEKNYELVVPVGSANLDSNVFAFNKDPESGSIRIVELYRIEVTFPSQTSRGLDVTDTRPMATLSADLSLAAEILPIRLE